ncbi:MAG: uroporphyrinogen-III C-methyltransferase [Magnetococcus sp. WYHC-3]
MTQPVRLFPPGSVALVGAGPGDPELLTLAALRALENCDVVVYDALISDEIRALIPPGVTEIFAGKRGGLPSVNQTDICDTLIQLAREGRRVVRLKGGDPFLFGRGGEEAERLVAEGIPFRVIPGVTAGIAGPAYAGIPVTHRSVNALVAFVTGHEATQSPETANRLTGSRVDWESVARAFPVVVMYMAMKNLGMVCGRLMNGGMSPDLPVAVIRWATTPRQETLVSTLSQVAAAVEHLQLEPPAIIVVGEVVRYRQSLSWYADQALTYPPLD